MSWAYPPVFLTRGTIRPKVALETLKPNSDPSFSWPKSLHQAHIRACPSSKAAPVPLIPAAPGHPLTNLGHHLYWGLEALHRQCWGLSLIP